MTTEVKIRFNNAHLQAGADSVNMDSTLELILGSDVEVEVDGRPTDAKDVLQGDTFSYTKDGVTFSGVVIEVLPVEQELDHEGNQDKRIAALETLVAAQASRIATLETALVANNQAVQNFQRNIVELTANHIERLFSDPIMIDTLASRFMVAGANALAYKAKQSRDRAPQLIAIDNMIPACTLRAKLTEDGVTVVEHIDNEGAWIGGEELPEAYRSEQFVNAIGNLLLSREAEVDKFYFITDDVTFDDFRQAAQKSAAENLNAVKEHMH